MKITITYVQSTLKTPLDTAFDTYVSRLNRFVTFTEKRIRGGEESNHSREKEAQKIIKAWDASRHVLLSRQGRSLTNETWLKAVRGWLESPPRQVTFIIGGAGGIHPDLSTRADEIISLSRLTLPHTLARLLLYEQLYRALTRMHGIKYHKSSPPAGGGRVV